MARTFHLLKVFFGYTGSLGRNNLTTRLKLCTVRYQTLEASLSSVLILNLKPYRSEDLEYMYVLPAASVKVKV
jgi:hypothetical protein